MAPMEIEYVENDSPSTLLPSYEFEPSSDALLDEMLPKYLKTRIYAALLDAAASESAARRAACKAATDNANDIIKNLSPAGQPGQAGADHPGTHRDRRRRRCSRRLRK